MSYHRAVELDDTLPTAAEAERQFLSKAPQQQSAIDFLATYKIAAGPILAQTGRLALIDYDKPFDWSQRRYQFVIKPPSDADATLAVPIFEADQFVDLCLIDCKSWDHSTACGRAHWLGGERLVGAREIRLHSHPMDWLASGCRGVAHVSMHSTAALSDLLKVDRVLCDSIGTAIHAWDRLADDDNYKPGSFVLDDDLADVLKYFRKPEGQLRLESAR